MNNANVTPVNVNDVFDTEEIEVTAGGAGLDLPPATYSIVVWGVVSYKDKGYGAKENEIVNKKLIVVQFPSSLDDKGMPKIGWVYGSEAFSGKSNFHKHFKEMLGQSIGTDHPLRLPNGNLDPKKITGINALASVGNVSKKEGEEKIGIINFAPLVAGMPEYGVNNGAVMPEYIVDLKNGKALQNLQASAVPVVPVLPQAVAPVVQAAVPIQPQPVVQPAPVQAQPVAPVQPVQPVQPIAQPPVMAQPVQPQQPVQTEVTQGMFNQAVQPTHITDNPVHF